ncbi:hypothetical protein Sjap_020136 [Stephania japonica]|uniref:Uncharacterized protein n=1 Tax=Stephania japonica TaxID=461633 RepID=A0AAP0HYR6_9MAGN
MEGGNSSSPGDYGRGAHSPPRSASLYPSAVGQWATAPWLASVEAVMRRRRVVSLPLFAAHHEVEVEVEGLLVGPCPPLQRGWGFPAHPLVVPLHHHHHLDHKTPIFTPNSQQIHENEMGGKDTSFGLEHLLLLSLYKFS